MELAQHGVVQFMAADFEIHLRTIDGTRAEVIEPEHNFLPPLRFESEARRHHEGRFSGDLLPLGPYLWRIKKDDSERGQLVFFTGWRLARHTTGEGQQNDDAPENWQPPSLNRIVNFQHYGTHSKRSDPKPEPADSRP